MKPEQLGRKINKSYPVRKEVIKLSLFIVNMILYRENPKEHTHIPKSKNIKPKTQKPKLNQNSLELINSQQS